MSRAGDPARATAYHDKVPRSRVILRTSYSTIVDSLHQPVRSRTSPACVIHTLTPQHAPRYRARTNRRAPQWSRPSRNNPQKQPNSDPPSEPTRPEQPTSADSPRRTHEISTTINRLPPPTPSAGRERDHTGNPGECVHPLPSQGRGPGVRSARSAPPAPSAAPASPPPPARPPPLRRRAAPPAPAPAAPYPPAARSPAPDAGPCASAPP